MQTIWKFPVSERNFSLNIPEGAQILSVQAQGNKGQMWVLVDPQARKETRVFWAINTGDPLPKGNLKYIGTYQLDKGNYVLHVFEEF